MQGEKHFCDQPPGGFKTPTIPQSLSISGNVWINSFHFQTKARASSTKKEQRPLSCPSAWISDAWIGDQIDWWPGHVRSSAFVARGCRCRWRIHSVRSNSNFPKTFNTSVRTILTGGSRGTDAGPLDHIFLDIMYKSKVAVVGGHMVKVVAVIHRVIGTLLGCAK